MGEAKRRRIAGAGPRDINAALRVMRDEGQNVWDIEVVFPWNVVGLIERAAAGDRRAAILFEAVDGCVRSTAKASPPRLCLLCDHEFVIGTRPAAFVMLTPHVDTFSHATGSGLCMSCASAEDLMERVFRAYRDGAFGGGARLVAPESGPGHA